MVLCRLMMLPLLREFSRRLLEADTGTDCGLDPRGWRVRYVGGGGWICDRLADDWRRGVVFCCAWREAGWTRVCAGRAYEWSGCSGSEQSVDRPSRGG